MARRRRKNPREEDVDPRSFAATLERHLESLRVLGYSEHTLEGRAKILGRFIAWCG